MEDIESINLCETCRKELDCFKKGIFERETCIEYEPLPLQELLERDKFVREVMVGACPRCNGNNTYDCRNNPAWEDESVGHCLDCETYWCLECGYVFGVVEKGMQCPHWEICAQCTNEHGYLDQIEFMDRICPTCEHYDEGCHLEDPLQCHRQWQFLCPYDGNVSECPKIEELLREQI